MIIGALLCRNEADRYLRRALTNAASFCDALVVLDDGSTDDTATVCREFGADVETLAGQNGGWWGGQTAQEVPARARLWQRAVDRASDAGWIYVFDADHELLGLTREGLRTLCKADTVNGWAFPLWDCWNDDQTHRVDGYWQAWRTPRVWLARAQPVEGFAPAWPARGLHVGHLPNNYPLVAVPAPTGVAIRHLGYLAAADREAKARQYLAHA